MTFGRALCLTAAPLLLAAACGLLALVRAPDVRSSFDELVGASGTAVPAAIRQRSAGLVPVLVSAADGVRARNVADRLNEALPLAVGDDCQSIRYRHADSAVADIIDFCRSHRSGLASPQASERLKTKEGRAAIARAALRQYFSSPVPPMFPPADDPFALTDGFVKALPTSFSGWFPKDGVLTAERDGCVHLLTLLELKPEVTDSLDRLTGFKSRLDAVLDAHASDGVAVAACGVPLHTAASAARCRREISALTWFSVVFIILLSVVVFRGLRWLPLMAMSLAVSVLAGLFVLMAAFGGFHLLTLVFGTTVMGLVIDYSFHWLMHDGADRAETVRNLLVSFVTTEVSLLPLMLSSIPILRQSAVFLASGLAVALAFVVWLYPRQTTATAPRPVSSRNRRLVLVPAALVLLAALWGWRTTGFGTDLAAIYRPPTGLAQAERMFALIGGSEDAARGFLVTTGVSLEESLTKEESVPLDDRVARLSRILPSLARRQSVSADIARLYAEHGERQAAALGLPSLTPPPPPVPWNASRLPAELARPFLSVAGGDAVSLVVAAIRQPSGPLPSGVVFCRPRAFIASVLNQWSHETVLRLVVALVLMFAVLFACFRARAFRVFLPSLLTLAAMPGLLVLLGERVNLFHLLAGFLLAGMSVDYTVFLQSGKALRPAFCSLMTSMAGFGALVFVSFPVVRAFGEVLGVGLPLSFVLALAVRSSPPCPSASSAERAASPLGMELLYFFYLACGLRALHLGAAVVGFTVWVFSGKVRQASPSLTRTLLFTRSLADKLVVMAEGRSLPKVTVEETPDAAEFMASVQGGKGVFVLSSHCGTVEMLMAIGDCQSTFHAWMDTARTSVFTSFYLRHARRRRVVIHSVSEIGMDTAFLAGEALDRGDSLVMAGDRGPGAFRFAHAMGAPTYFVACVATGPTSYRAIIRRLPGETAAMREAYSSILEEVTTAWPDQWFEWHVPEKGVS